MDTWGHAACVCAERPCTWCVAASPTVVYCSTILLSTRLKFNAILMKFKNVFSKYYRGKPRAFIQPLKNCVSLCSVRWNCICRSVRGAFHYVYKYIYSRRPIVLLQNTYQAHALGVRRIIYIYAWGYTLVCYFTCVFFYRRFACRVNRSSLSVLQSSFALGSWFFMTASCTECI